jgi:hypothetical protein
MGCCTSAIEVSVEDLRPYGFVLHGITTVSYCMEILARKRHSAKMIESARRFTLQRDNCSRLIEQANLDYQMHAAAADKARRSNAVVLVQSEEDELRRILRHATHLRTMRSVADHYLRGLSEERLGTELMATLEDYTRIPFLRFDEKRWERLLENLAKRKLLTEEQHDRYREILVDATDDATETETSEMDISEATTASAEDLARLAGVAAPATL